jgi:RNA polymerase sigma factor (TIGR02999 family)
MPPLFVAAAARMTAMSTKVAMSAPLPATGSGLIRGNGNGRRIWSSPARDGLEGPETARFQGDKIRTSTDGRGQGMVTQSPRAGASEDVTGLLARWSGGDKDAERDLFRLVHRELRRIAHRYVGRGRGGRTLQTSAVVNEAYLRLVARPGSRWQDRAHFFAVSARAMRHILIDYARGRGSLKRGGQAPRVTLDEAAVPSLEKPDDLVALDEALDRLAAESPRRAQVVELRYFGGLSNEEIGEVLKVSPATVERDWRYARAWLFQELAGA